MSVRLIPAPQGAGIVSASTPKKILQMAGIQDVYTASQVSRVEFPSHALLVTCALRMWPLFHAAPAVPFPSVAARVSATT